MYSRGTYTGHWGARLEAVGKNNEGEAPCKCAGPDDADSSEDDEVATVDPPLSQLPPPPSAKTVPSDGAAGGRDKEAAAAKAVREEAARAGDKAKDVYVCRRQPGGTEWRCEEQLEFLDSSGRLSASLTAAGGSFPWQAGGGIQAPAVARSAAPASPQALALYKEWLETHGGQAHSVPQAHVFAELVALVEAHNAGQHGEHYTLTHNTGALGHVHAHDKRVSLNANRYWLTHPQSFTLTTARAKAHPLPARKSWVSWLQPPKDQLQCGSCWIFSATSVMEGFYARSQPNNRVVLDEQAIIDQKNGCEGGDPGEIMHFVLEEQGGKALGKVVMEGGDTAVGGPLNLQGAAAPGKVGGAPPSEMVQLGAAAVHVVELKEEDTLEQREDAFMRALVEHGPLCAGVASQGEWNLYDKGVIMPKQEYGFADLNHAVCIVGYDVDSKGRGTWIMRNCWGTSWGEGGYFRLPRGPKWDESSKKWGRDGPFGLLAFPSQYLV